MLVLIIFISYCTWNCTHKFFLWKLSTTVSLWAQFKDLPLQLVPRARPNQKWSRQAFHQYIVWNASTRHGDVILEKVGQMFCGKENFDGKWRMPVCNWVKVKLLILQQYQVSFPVLFTACWYVCSWDINFFVTPVFKESEAVSVSQISATFELKNACSASITTFLTGFLT